MPLRPGAPVGTAIRELKTGKQYKRTKRKFGASRAKKQALAIALKNSRTAAKNPKRHSKKGSHR